MTAMLRMTTQNDITEDVPVAVTSGDLTSSVKITGHDVAKHLFYHFNICIVVSEFSDVLSCTVVRTRKAVFFLRPLFHLIFF